MAYISPLLTNIVTIVKKASVNLSRDFSEIERLQTSIKGSLDFTRIAFDKAQKGIAVELSKFGDTYPVVFAGKNPEKLKSYFSVSIIEGLANFAHGNPWFGISVALIDNGVVVASVIYNPALDELFFAEKGKGAFKEGFRSHERLRVSAKQELEGALVAVKPDVNDKETTYKFINNVVGATGDVRVSGALGLDLAYLAAGKIDAVIAPNAMQASIAAGILLVKEAGGMVLDIEQKDTRTEDLKMVLNSGNLMAVNFNLSQKIAKVLK
ncbi:MAG: inositol monophosphatase [Alphaproteobacteria bacterium]|nr:inositol monophosphatase [Alphaproteobacteria bacterium]